MSHEARTFVEMRLPLSWDVTWRWGRASESSPSVWEESCQQFRYVRFSRVEQQHSLTPVPGEGLVPVTFYSNGFTEGESLSECSQHQIFFTIPLNFPPMRCDAANNHTDALYNVLPVNTFFISLSIITRQKVVTLQNEIHGTSRVQTMLAHQLLSIRFSELDSIRCHRSFS